MLSKDTLIKKTYAGFVNSKQKVLNLNQDDIDIQAMISNLKYIEKQLKKSEQNLTNYGQTGSYFIHFNKIGKQISIPQRISYIAQNTQKLSKKLSNLLTTDNLQNFSQKNTTRNYRRYTIN